ALAHHGIVTLRKLHDEVVRIGALGSGNDLIRLGIEPSISNVLADGATEQQHVLGHERHLTADIRQRIVVCRTTIEEDTPPHRLIKLQHQGGNRRFTGPAGTDNSELFASLCLKRYTLQHRDLGARRIGKRDVLDRHRALNRVLDVFFGQQQIFIFLLLIEDFYHALTRADSSLDVGIQLRKATHRTGHKQRVKDIRCQVAHGNIASGYQYRYIPNHGNYGTENTKNDKGCEY